MSYRVKGESPAASETDYGRGSALPAVGEVVYQTEDPAKIAVGETEEHHHGVVEDKVVPVGEDGRLPLAEAGLVERLLVAPDESFEKLAEGPLLPPVRRHDDGPDGICPEEVLGPAAQGLGEGLGHPPGEGERARLDLFALALDQGEGRLVQGDFVCEDVLFVHGHVVGLSEIEKLALDRSCRLEIGSFDIAEIFDDAEISDSEGELIGKTRHIFRFDRLCDFEEELLKQLNPHYSRGHFVSKRLNCILSVYDQRGCDIVFFDKRHFKKAYFLLHEYLFDYDMKLMESRLKSLLFS